MDHDYDDDAEGSVRMTKLLKGVEWKGVGQGHNREKR